MFSWLIFAAVSSLASITSAEGTVWNCSFGSFNDSPPVNCSIKLDTVGHLVRWFVTYRENNFTESQPYLRASLNNPGVREGGNTTFFLPPAAIPPSGRGIILSFRYLFNSNTTTSRKGSFQVLLGKDGDPEATSLPKTTGWKNRSFTISRIPLSISFIAERGADYTNAGIDDISVTAIPYLSTESGQSTATSLVSTLRRKNTQKDLEQTTTSSFRSTTLTKSLYDHLKTASNVEQQTTTESPAQSVLIYSSVLSVTVVCLMCAIIIVCIRRKHRPKPASSEVPDEDDNGLVVNQLYDATDDLHTSPDILTGVNAPSSNLETHIHNGMDNNYEDIEENRCRDMTSRSINTNTASNANTYFTLEAPIRTNGSKLDRAPDNEYEGVDKDLYCNVDDRPDQDSKTCNDITYFTLENPSNKGCSNLDQYPENEYEDIRADRCGAEALKRISQNKISGAKNGQFLGARNSPNQGDGALSRFDNGPGITNPAGWDDPSTPAYFTLESRSSDGDGGDHGDTRIDSLSHEVNALTGQVPHVMNAPKKNPRGIQVMPSGQGLSNFQESKDLGSKRCRSIIRNHNECPYEGSNSKSHLGSHCQRNRSTGKPEGPTKIRLSDDAEYDSLNFRTSFKKSSKSKETSNGTMADDVDNMVYDALNFTDTADSPNSKDTSVFNDNVYSTLN